MFDRCIYSLILPISQLYTPTCQARLLLEVPLSSYHLSKADVFVFSRLTKNSLQAESSECYYNISRCVFVCVCWGGWAVPEPLGVTGRVIYILSVTRRYVQGNADVRVFGSSYIMQVYRYYGQMSHNWPHLPTDESPVGQAPTVLMETLHNEWWQNRMLWPRVVSQFLAYTGFFCFGFCLFLFHLYSAAVIHFAVIASQQRTVFPKLWGCPSIRADSPSPVLLLYVLICLWRWPRRWILTSRAPLSLIITMFQQKKS